MAETTLFLTEMTAPEKSPPAPVFPLQKAQHSSLEKLTAMLPSPMLQLEGMRAGSVALPDNIVCFSRSSATDLNRPQRGRALHHRHVLILALKTEVTVCVDDRDIHLPEGDGLIVMPFQFHDYIDPVREELTWLFITFDLENDSALEALRYRPFTLTPAIRQVVAELITTYMKGDNAELITILFSLLLLRIRQLKPGNHATSAVTRAPGLITQVNQLAQGKAVQPSLKEMAAALGISPSHLRTRFRESCGVSLGKHLRRLRLEKACGLLRMGTERVSEVSDLCGFSSVYTFSRAFHATYGISPLQYRKGRHKNSDCG